MNQRLTMHGRKAVRGAVALALALAFGGCSDSAEENACGFELNAKVEALVKASSDLAFRAEALQVDVTLACERIVADLGGTPVPEGSDPNAYTQAVCQQAATAIDAAVSDAALTISVAIEPPVCTIDAQAQLDCESSCYVDASCDPGTIETRCEPGELSVVCEGTCQADAYCEASATGTVACSSACDGICIGTCDTVDTGAGVNCEGTCVGQCQGSCQVTAEANGDCGASARCRGGCEGSYSLPECRTELTPPSCTVDADCQAACDAQGSFNAECTEPSVVVVATGTAQAAALAATLEANLPALVAVGENLNLLAGDVTALVQSANAVALEVSGIPACAAVQLQELNAAVQAAIEAAASVEVTVSVSVCVSGSTDPDAPPPSCN